MQMEHNMARNPNWWEANKLAMLQAWLPEDLNSGPSAYKSTVLFFSICLLYWIFYQTQLFTRRHIYDQSSCASGRNRYQLGAPQTLTRAFSRRYRQLICNYYSETSIMRIYCLSYGNGQPKKCNLFCNITVKRLAEKQYVVRLITNTTTGPHQKS